DFAAMPIDCHIADEPAATNLTFTAALAVVTREITAHTSSVADRYLIRIRNSPYEEIRFGGCSRTRPLQSNLASCSRCFTVRANSCITSGTRESGTRTNATPLYRGVRRIHL